LVMMADTSRPIQPCASAFGWMAIRSQPWSDFFHGRILNNSGRWTIAKHVSRCRVHTTLVLTIGSS
jgi:hypothetical protein